MAAHTLHTVGHSTRSAGERGELLREFSGQRVAGIRTVPRSRTDPQFDLDRLPATPARAGTGHNHCRGPGGLRRASKNPVSTAWRNASFRGDGDRITHLGGEPCGT